METLTHNTIGAIVRHNYKAAGVFKNYGIDFCCGGNKTIAEVCREKNINAEAVERELETVLATQPADAENFDLYSLTALAEHIEQTHHKYIEAQAPLLQQYLEKIAKVHGKNHPVLEVLKNEFSVASGQLAQHMKKEELILFPFVKKMEQMKYGDRPVEQPPFGTVQNPVTMMMLEHDTEGERFRKMTSLTHNYSPPEDACNTYRVSFALLKEFEDNLHQHIHLENNILFPKAIALEKDLFGGDSGTCGV